MSNKKASISEDTVVYHFHVDGLKCQGCSSTIEHTLGNDDKIISASCNHVTKTLIVEVHKKFHPDFVTQHIITSVTNLGFECEIEKPEQPKKNLLHRWAAGALGIASGLTLMVLMMAGIGFSLPVMIAIAAMSTALTAVLGFEFYLNAAQIFMRSKEMNMNTLFAISTLTILTVSIGSFFIPWMPMVFDAGLMIFGFRHLGIAIEESLKQNVTSNLQFTDFVPKTVKVVNESSSAHQPLKDIKVGQTIEIGPGEVIPLDGVVLNNDSMLYDTINTGSRTPRVSVTGESIPAGSFLAANAKPLLLRVSQPPELSYLSKFDKQINHAHQKPPIQTIARSLLNYFIPGVLALSLISFSVIGLFFPMAIAVQCAVAVLVSACPCTLGMIIPLSSTIGMSKASEKGVHFKSTKAMEEFGTVSESFDKVVFDLHGTLTEGAPEVTDVIVIDEAFTDNDVTTLAALIEQKATHPVANAIKKHAKNTSESRLKQHTIKDIDMSYQNGLTALVEEQRFIIGNRDMMVQAGIFVPPEPKHLKAGDSRVYLADETHLIGIIELRDPLRKDAKQVVDALKKKGVEPSICTGADPQTASRYAKLLNIDAVNAGFKGDEGVVNPKAQYIDSLKNNNHTVLMVGDGPNDAAALARADGSIAVMTGSDIGHQIAREQAHATIDDSSLLPVLDAVHISSETAQVIQQNLWFSLAYNATTLAFAGGGLLLAGLTLHPAIGAAMMILQSASILLNTYRFKHSNVSQSACASECSMDEPSSYQSMMQSQSLQNGLQDQKKQDCSNDTECETYFGRLFDEQQSGVSPVISEACQNRMNEPFTGSLKA